MGAAVAVLQDIGTKGDENTIQTLSGFAGDEDARVRVESLKALGRIAEKDDYNALALLKDHLNDSDPDVLDAAFHALTHLTSHPAEEAADVEESRKLSRTSSYLSEAHSGKSS